MLKRLKIFIGLVVLIFLFATCKKYPDGPVFSFRTVLNRLAGTYVLNNYIVNNTDSTNLIPPTHYAYNVNYAPADGKYYFWFDRHNNISGVDGTGGYYLSDNKKNIALGYSIDVYPNPAFQARNVLEPVHSYAGLWEILKLTDKEFWIKETAGNLTFEIHLKKIHSL